MACIRGVSILDGLEFEQYIPATYRPVTACMNTYMAGFVSVVLKDSRASLIVPMCLVSSRSDRPQLQNTHLYPIAVKLTSRDN